MPQGRKKIPFSGKQKKEQIQAKRKSKDSKNYLRKPKDESDENEETTSTGDNVQKLNVQPRAKSSQNSSRYALHFHKESRKELLLMKQEARTEFIQVSLEDREIDERYFNGYDFPTRPGWNYDMSKEHLDRIENRYFTEYVQKLEKSHTEESKILSLFELNLETWRQLWRVLEISDILLIIVDVRFPALTFPPSIYTYVTEKLKKSMILVLNKIDLVPGELVIAWKNYFLEKYPEMSVVLISTCSSQNFQNSKSRKKNTKLRVATEAASNIYKSCLKIVGNDLDLSSWEQKILEEMQLDATNKDEPDDYKFETDIPTYKEDCDFKFEEHVKYKNGILTIGCIGFPNVGKSSVINALKGRKVVSVSRTPGHTKHFQTIFLTEKLKLCDCPGLVFPSSTPKYLQVLLGSYPVAQLREPYCSIKYLGERLDLPKKLNVPLPEGFTEWSAEAICEAWALKRGFLTAKASRPDHYRAANNILRMALEGKIVLEFYPPSYIKNYDNWKNHPDLEDLKKLVDDGKTQQTQEGTQNVSSSDLDDESADCSEREESSETDVSSSSSLPAQNKNVFELLKEE